MLKYQIGRIEGRWTNFIPPIQDGKFRTLDEQQLVEESEIQDSSSEPSSAEGSPIFEPAETPTSGLRYRSQGAKLERASSTSSLSSLDIEEVSSEPKLSHFDARTRQEVQLDLEKYPSLDPETQEDIVNKYRVLAQRLQDEGLFQCNYTAYGIECIRYVLLFMTSMVLLRYGQYVLSGAFLGMFWHQLVFTVHDASHMGITHNFQIDSVFAIFLASYLGGLSACWWKRNHNVHHIVTNSPEHDPDIEHMPFLAISHRFFENLTSSYYNRLMTYDAVARTTIRMQHYLYYPLLCVGRFNLYVLSWEYLIKRQGPRRGQAAWLWYLEVLGQVFFWTWFGYGILYRSIPTGWDRFNFIMVSHVITMVVHVQITLSHFAMSTADLGPQESFPQKMLRTTMDVDCPEWLDFFHGGLQFQAVHHLFPRIPRHNLRRAQKLVMEFCEDAGIPYALYGFVDGNKKVIGQLADVARQAKILAECQRVMVEKGDFGMH